MTRRLGWLGLLVFLMLGTAVWTLWPAPCSKPIAYRLGPVDERFGLSGDEVLAALRQAGAVWEQGLGRKLFTYDPRAPLTVNLVFDDRQQTTQGGRRLRSVMQELQASHESVGKSFAEWQATYERRARNYELAYADYQQRAAAWVSRESEIPPRPRRACRRNGVSSTRCGAISKATASRSSHSERL